MYILFPAALSHLHATTDTCVASTEVTGQIDHHDASVVITVLCDGSGDEWYFDGTILLDGTVYGLRQINGIDSGYFNLQKG